MRKPLQLAAFLFLAALWPAMAFARGGGGCFEAGTPVLTPNGPIAIERLQPGEFVWTAAAGELRAARVQLRTEVIAEEWIEVRLEGREVRVTAEHPMAVAPGVFRVASELRSGDEVQVWDGRELRATAVESVRRVPGQRRVHNLLVDDGTFLAHGLLVHNKGCFLPDTPILRADGASAPLSDVRVGDELLAFTPDGAVTRAQVHRLLAHEVDEYVVVRTERAVLRVTAEHPFYVGQGTFKTLEALTVGGTVFAHDGHGLSPQRILGLERVQGRVQVFNLQTDAPNTFFAHGFAVHNKGGCFPAGTMIRTPQGERAIEDLASGDLVLAVDENGQLTRTAIEALYATRSPLVILETDDGRILRTTAEHPLQLASGGFQLAGGVVAGQSVLVCRRSQLQPVHVRSLRALNEEQGVFNLRVGAPHTFIADGFVAHNKGGGCFPVGTPVRTPSGETAIERLRLGDAVLAVRDDGRLALATVEKVFVSRERLLALETDDGQFVRITPDHPLRLPQGGFCGAGGLQPGDSVLGWRDGHLAAIRVRSLSLPAEEAEVVNLHVSAPHTFIAGGLVAHNKGGRSSHGRSRGGGRPPPLWLIAVIVGAWILIVILAAISKSKQAQDLDYLHSPRQIAGKADKTGKLLEFIAKNDTAFGPDALRKVATATFVKLQECWQAREYTPMQPLLMPDLYAQHCGQIRGMVRNHEINVIESLAVERVDLVNVRYTHKADDREFTALIQASARDYYIDDRTNEYLRGDETPARFQEFWTFQRQNGQWRLREIEQTRESDKLDEENFFEPFTDKTVEQIYAEAAGQKGPIGPWLEKKAATKANRIERLLSFLVQTDKLWNRQEMLERARQVFTRVFMAREAGDIAQVTDGDLFPAVATDLRGEISRRQRDGVTVEFRNFCVRKVELILVNNYSDNRKDEFTVRISAHAQRIVKKGGGVVSQDEYVSPFEEYWTFGRLDGQWKLEEVQPPAVGRRLLAQENLDQDSSREQLQWYYQRSRAD